MSSGVVVVVAVVVFAAVLGLFVALSVRKEKTRVASLSDEERRREAAIKKWGNQRRGNQNSGSDFDNELF